MPVRPPTDNAALCRFSELDMAMAREEEPREDLLREATALVERVELQIEGFAEPSSPASAAMARSFYFGQDFVFQFNTANQLRRGYVEGRLYKAEAGRLVQLTRQRTANEVELLRHDCNDTETQEFLANASSKLVVLQKALVDVEFRTIGQVPASGDLAGRVRDWLLQSGAAHRAGLFAEYLKQHSMADVNCCGEKPLDAIRLNVVKSSRTFGFTTFSGTQSRLPWHCQIFLADLDRLVADGSEAFHVLLMPRRWKRAGGIPWCEKRATESSAKRIGYRARPR